MQDVRLSMVSLVCTRVNWACRIVKSACNIETQHESPEERKGENKNKSLCTRQGISNIYSTDDSRHWVCDFVVSSSGVRCIHTTSISVQRDAHGLHCCQMERQQGISTEVPPCARKYGKFVEAMCNFCMELGYFLWIWWRDRG